MREGGNNGLRRQLALALVTIWMVGFELLPNLHVALHDELPCHSHGAAAGGVADSGTRVRVYFGGEHSHADHHHEDSSSPGLAHQLALHHPRVATGDLIVVTPSRPAQPGHGVHSLAHRGLAVAQPPPAATLPPIVEVDMPAVLVALRQRPRSRRPQCQRVRGPPARELARV